MSRDLRRQIYERNLYVTADDDDIEEVKELRRKQLIKWARFPCLLDGPKLVFSCEPCIAKRLRR